MRSRSRKSHLNSIQSVYQTSRWRSGRNMHIFIMNFGRKSSVWQTVVAKTTTTTKTSTVMSAAPVEATDKPSNMMWHIWFSFLLFFNFCQMATNNTQNQIIHFTAYRRKREWTPEIQKKSTTQILTNTQFNSYSMHISVCESHSAQAKGYYQICMAHSIWFRWPCL